MIPLRDGLMLIRKKNNNMVHFLRYYKINNTYEELYIFPCSLCTLEFYLSSAQN